MIIAGLLSQWRDWYLKFERKVVLYAKLNESVLGRTKLDKKNCLKLTKPSTVRVHTLSRSVSFAL